MNIDLYAFVSYARKDKSFVDRLSHDLRRSGVKIWRDVDDILPGAHWQREIEKALKGSIVLLYVSSKNTRASGWMARELEVFLRNRAKRIIPIVIDDEGATNLPEDLSVYQWADFRLGYEEGFRTLIVGLPGEIKQAEPFEPISEGSKGYVFISYAQEDGDFVSGLRSFLKSEGYAYWDYAESNRDYHRQFFLELEEKIRDAAATFSILSPSWKQSEWAVQEYFFSKEVDTPIFLLKAKKLGPTLPIAGMPFIDFTENSEEGFNRLHKELKRKGL